MSVVKTVVNFSPSRPAGQLKVHSGVAQQQVFGFLGKLKGVV